MDTNSKNKILTKVSSGLYDDGIASLRNNEMGKAAEHFFQAANLSYKGKDNLFSAKLYLMSFLAQIKDERYLKEKPNLDYLGRFDEICIDEQRYDIMIEGYKKICEQLRSSHHFELYSYCYLKEMNARKKYHWRQRRYALASVYWLWRLSSNYGESFIKLFLFIFAITLVQTIMLIPAPFKFMEAISINLPANSLHSFIDYLYLSISLIFSTNWDLIQPEGNMGVLFIVFLLIVRISIVSLFINLIIQKLSSK